MSVSSITNSTNPQPWQQVRNDYQSLSQALQNGNLTAAQNAFSSIQQDQQNGPQLPQNSQVAAAFDALGQALQSGDVSSAQQAFSSLQSDVKTARQARGAGGHHHGGGGGAGGAGGVDPTDSSSSDDATKTIASEVTTPNANGTLQVVTTYTDGSTETSTEPNPTPTVSQSPLAPNSGQLATLLGAQEQAQAV